MLYTALEVSTVIAEFELAAERGAFRRTAPRKLARIKVRLTRVLDATDPEVLRKLGVTTDNLTASDPATAQSIGEAAHYLGFEGILAKSAAGPGVVLAIFLDNRSANSELSVETVEEFIVPTGGSAPSSTKVRQRKGSRT